MNDTMKLDVPSQVAAFVAAVHGHFDDLSPADREDLLDGLEADVSDQVADRGAGVLADPAAYAGELRAAAGLPARRGGRRPGVDLEWLRPARELAVSVRPVWWVARAYVWVMLLHFAAWDTGRDTFDVAWLPTSSWGVGMVLWGLASVISVQIGRGRLWPGGLHRGLAPWLVLLSLNGVTLLGAGLVIDKVDSNISDYDPTNDEFDVNPSVITYQGRQSCTLRVYDDRGERLRDVRVEDQSGRQLPLHNRMC
jgi:hypothetical protein